MPLIPTPYAASKKLIAIDFSTIELLPGNIAVADALTTVTKKGVTHLTKGRFKQELYSWKPDSSFLTPEEFLEHVHYPPAIVCRWDGEIMWTPEPVALRKQVTYADELDPYFAAIPEVPPGYEGWFSFGRNIPRLWERR